MNEDVSEDEDYDEFLTWLKNKPVPKFVEWWYVENTGWSGGSSWFRIGGTQSSPLSFDSEESAKTYALTQKQKLNDINTKWRYVYSTLEREGNKSVTTNVWTEV
jgi:hypothetical protein